MKGILLLAIFTLVSTILFAVVDQAFSSMKKR
jgi:Na+-translocating ferredoxin:NAD+ oxidoreductase RnfG subunit